MELTKPGCWYSWQIVWRPLSTRYPSELDSKQSPIPNLKGEAPTQRVDIKEQAETEGIESSLEIMGIRFLPKRSQNEINAAITSVSKKTLSCLPSTDS